VMLSRITSSWEVRGQSVGMKSFTVLSCSNRCIDDTL
jgi:hypothetical protein